MSAQTYFGLSNTYYAQPVVTQDSVALFNGQNLIDAFSECDMELCNTMAHLLNQEAYENFGRMMAKMLRHWRQ